MPWACLCGENPYGDLEQIYQYSPANGGFLTSVAFQFYDLGPNSTINWYQPGDYYDNNITVNLSNWNLGSYPLIQTGNIEYLRQLFANPQPVISQAVQLAQQNGWSGWNIDFEPGSGTNQDGLDFAQFLVTFADALHSNGMKLSVDVASWNPQFWQFSAIASSSVDYVITMDTYANYDYQWTQAFNYAISQVPLNKLGIGLISNNSNDTYEMNQYLQAISSANIQQVDVWMLPFGTPLWDAIQQWATS